MNHQKAVARQRQRRRFRVSKRIRGTSERPRLAVFRTHKHIYAQIIDDSLGRTLASASTVEKDFGSDMFGGNTSAAQAIGRSIAERAVAAGVKQVCFDRRGFQYSGRVAALADAAREAGLSF